ncbi:MAG: ATP-dependent zinc metalloprotease FtsH [Parachlamydiaceae bacterium]|nr:ATP-dependent zinc metalloprotease FtsH [Parachlamydiaceae bacterium]
MADNNQEFKKGVSNNLVWFLMAAFLFVLLVQNFMDTKFAQVSFSYQLEHLVNLQLLQPEDSRKIALNDNLVTFSGKFRDRLTDEGKARYKYLDLLNTNHDLKSESDRLKKELETRKTKSIDSATYFLQLSGLPASKSGYVIVGDNYNTADEDNSIVIKSIPKSDKESLTTLEKTYATIKEKPSDENVKDLGGSIAEIIRNLRSPELGIGSESIKQNLKKLDQEITDNRSSASSMTAQLALYGKTLESLHAIVDDLNLEEDHIRLTKLRSVRNYKETLDENQRVQTRLEDNQIQLDKARQAVSSVVWFFNNQELSTRSLERQDPEIYGQWFNKAKEEWTNFAHNQGGVFKAPDQSLNTVLEKTFKSEEPSPNYFSTLFTLLPVFLVVLVLYLIFARQMKGMGNSAMNFGKSPARLLNKENNKTTFKDVAGVTEALEELEEIVEFLKNPQKFTALGGHIPKGVLLIGPPGTGKTLIAKAVAGEADRPFFSISGSDFVEMFVGVGASRIRDLFDQAKKAAPCIIFMDEIDAVGRHRGVGIGGGHDEREQTLNQLLVEMDGFDTNEGVILMAATNRPDVLDKALLRPGRFDRRVMIGLPDIKGRYEILKVHAGKIKMDPAVDLMAIARSTPGSSGADLANILNEAALLAARKGRSVVTTVEMVEARDKVLYGKERRSLEMDESEKKTTAYHEAGHTIVGLIVKSGDPIDKVTIIPRGFSLGSTMFLPKKNRLSYWKHELHDQIAVLMGGRIAEEIFVGDISSGAQQDIESATQLARNMVCKWGMSENLGTVTYTERSEGGGYGMELKDKPYSNETAQSIDVEVRNIMAAGNELARKIILENRAEMELLTQMLIEFETLDSEDIQEIVVSKTWDIEKKRARVKIAEDLHKMDVADVPPPPPPASVNNSDFLSNPV